MPSLRQFRWALALAAAVGAIPSVAVAQVDDRVAKVAALACQDNLDAFVHYKCRFTLTLAQAESAAKARAGGLKNVRHYEHMMVVDGGKEKIETLAAAEERKPESVFGMKGEHKLSGASKLSYKEVDWVPLGYLRNGDDVLSYTSMLQVASLFTKETSVNLPDALPLSMNVMGVRRQYAPWPILQRCEDRKFALTKAVDSAIDGRPVIELLFSHSGKPFTRFFLDPQQGYLPKEVVYYTAHEGVKVLNHVYLLEAKDCGKGRWFPTHVLSILAEYHNPVLVRDIRVTELETDKHPTDGDFALAIPAGTQIRHAKAGEPGLFNLKQDEKVTPDDIPRLFAMLEEKPKQPLMDTAIPKKGWPATSIYYGIGAVVSLLVCFVLWRRRR